MAKGAQSLSAAQAAAAQHTGEARGRLMSLAPPGVIPDEAGEEGLNEGMPLPSVLTNLPAWMLWKGCGSRGSNELEVLHPAVHFGRPQTYVHVKLVDDVRLGGDGDGLVQH